MASGYKLVSVGRVVEDKPRGTDYVLVALPELFYDQPSGKVDEYKETAIGKLLSTNLDNLQTEHEATTIVRAKWRPQGQGNRITAPDLYMNESVNIYQYGNNTEEFYWDEVSREHRLRGREDVVYGWSNREGGDPNSDVSMDESYTLRVNTHDKFIELNLTDNDGEASMYNIKIDTKAGVISIVDGLENSLILNSVEGKLTATIKEDVEINTKRVVVNAEESYTINTKNYYLNASDQSDTVTPLATYSEDVHIHNKLDVDNKTHLHERLEVDSDTHVHGNLMVDGSFDGGVGGGGAGTFHGSLTATGDLNTKSSMMVDGDLTVKGNAIGRYPGPKE